MARYLVDVDMSVYINADSEEEAKEKAYYVTDFIWKRGLKKALKKFNVI